MNIISLQRNIKKRRAYSLPSTSKQPKQTSLPRENPSRLPPAKRPLLFEQPNIKPETLLVSPVILRETALTSEQSGILDFSLENPALLPPAGSPLLVENAKINSASPAVLTESVSFPLNIKAEDKSGHENKETSKQDDQQLKVAWKSYWIILLERSTGKFDKAYSTDAYMTWNLAFFLCPPKHLWKTRSLWFQDRTRLSKSAPR